MHFPFMVATALLFGSLLFYGMAMHLIVRTRVPSHWPLPGSVRRFRSCKTPVMNGRPPTYDEPLDLTRRQAPQIDQLRTEVEWLKAEREQTRRAGKRQAAPFFKGSPKPYPKRPGRKAGHPPSHRPAPPPERVDRTVEVPLPDTCPGCHASLDEATATVHDQYQIDLSEPKPVVTRFCVPVTRCPACSRRVGAAIPNRPRQVSQAAAQAPGQRATVPGP